MTDESIGHRRKSKSRGLNPAFAFRDGRLARSATLTLEQPVKGPSDMMPSLIPVVVMPVIIVWIVAILVRAVWIVANWIIATGVIAIRIVDIRIVITVLPLISLRLGRFGWSGACRQRRKRKDARQRQ